MTMRVAIDGRRLQDRPLGGVGRSFTNLVPRLATEAEVVVLTDSRRPVPEDPVIAALAHPLSVPRRAHEAPWLHVAVARWLRDWDGLFHGTFNQLPLWSRVRTVVTIHDLSFEHHPDDFGPASRRWFQLQARRAAGTAQRVLTPTEAVRGEVASAYGVDRSTIVVAPNAVDPIFHRRPPAEVGAALATLGVTPPYVIALGGARRRGLAVATAAWSASGANDKGIGLVVVGTEQPTPGDGIVWVGPVDDGVWAGALAGARALIYPTRYEGFGMPALEAIASGTPVVCAPVPALVEVLGDAAEWCASATAEDVAAGLARVVEDDQHRDALVAAGLRRAAAAPGWDQIAVVTLRAYHESLA